MNYKEIKCASISTNQCDGNSLNCDSCNSYCRSYVPTLLNRIQGMKTFVLTKDMLLKLRNKAEIFDNLEGLVEDGCYTTDNEHLTNIKLLGAGGGGEAFKRCFKNDGDMCFVYKVSPYISDMFSLEGTAIMFMKYLSSLSYEWGGDVANMSVIEEYGNFECNKPPSGSRLPSNTRVIVSIIELAATDLLKLMKNNRIPICVFKSIILDVIVSLSVWEEHEMNHNDLKADNIFISFQSPSLKKMVNGYEVNIFGIKPLLADYDWATFNMSEEFKERFDIQTPDRRYCNARIKNEDYSQGWRGQSCEFDPYYDVYSFLSEMVYQLTTIVYGEYSLEMKQGYTNILEDFFPFAVKCTGLDSIIKPPFTEQSYTQFMDVVTGDGRMFRRWGDNFLPYVQGSKTASQILRENVDGYFTQYI